MLWILLTTSLLLCGGIHAGVPLENLFKFGPEHGDQNATGSRSSKIELDPSFAIFGKEQNYVIISALRGYMASASSFIKPFSAHIDLKRGGSVYYQKSNNSEDLNKARAVIGSKFSAFQDIDLKWVVVATWVDVAPVIHSYNATNTFQAVLITDGSRTFAIFSYHKIGWYLYEHGMKAYAQLLLEDDDEEQDYTLPGSQSAEMLTLTNRTNVGIPGQWIFRIDQTTIYEPSMLCGKPPQTLNGYCNATEYTQGSLANCTCNAGYKMDSNNSSPLKCSLSTDGNSVALSWVGNVSTCSSITPPSDNNTQPLLLCPRIQSICSLCSNSITSLKCPSPPVPRNGICQEKDYVPGSFAKCTCNLEYRTVNPDSRLYCTFDDEGNLFWSGGVTACVKNSVAPLNQ